MRVSLPDRPGSLGAVASAMGSVGVDITAVEIVEKRDDLVVDDFILIMPPGKLPDSLISVCQGLEGVQVEWISRYPEGGGLQSDLETLERMANDPDHAAETLVASAPAVFRSQWAVLVEVADQTTGKGTVSYSSSMAPDFSPDTLRPLRPFDRAHRVDLPDRWLPGWSESTMLVSPLTLDRAIVIGRTGGPAYLRSEVARLNLLATLVS
ncbi:MAG: amino acid-binding protein [Propionibacteriaceae bacterium]